LHEIQTAGNCQTEKRGRNEIIAVAKILLTNQMVLIVNCDFFFLHCLRWVHPMKTISFEFSQIWSYACVFVSNRRFRVWPGLYRSSISFYIWPNQRDDMTQTLKDCQLQ